MSWLSAMVFWALTAGAAELYFEGPVQEARADAVSSSRTIRDAGHKTRVIRRYRDGAGWEYLVRVSGFDTKKSALAIAPDLVDALGEVVLYRLDDPESEPVRVQFVAGEGSRTPSKDETANGDVQKVEAERLALQPSILAHGGPTGGAAKIREADRVLFRFRRTLADGAVIDHTWARNGDDLYVALEKIEGEVTPSRTLVLDDQAWLAADGSAYTPQDVEKARDTLEDFAPERVIPFVLSFAELANDRKELQILRQEGTADLDGHTVKVYQSEGDQASGPLVVQTDARTDLVRRVEFNEGVAVQFDAWKAQSSGPVRLPGKVRTWKDGELMDTVEILEMDLAPEFPKGWFEAP